MSKVSSAKHPRTTTTRKTNEQDRLSDQDFQQKLVELADRWQSQDWNDLALRHETGQLLNAYLGNPDRRQTYGTGTLKKAAEQLRRTETELSQLRRFAFRFKTFEDFQQKHCDVTTWTQVRDLLARLGTARKSKTGTDQGKARTGGEMRKLLDHLPKLTKALGTIKMIEPESDQAKQLLVQIQAFVEAVPDCLRSALGVQKMPTQEVA